MLEATSDSGPSGSETYEISKLIIAVASQIITHLKSDDEEVKLEQSCPTEIQCEPCMYKF